MYIHCNELSNGNQLCSFGTSSIIKKVPVLTSFGNLIYDNELILNDANDVSMRSLNRLHFRFTDASGRVLNMNGTTSSFSLTFLKVKKAYIKYFNINIYYILIIWLKILK